MNHLSNYIRNSIIYLSITDDNFISVVSGIDLSSTFLNPIPFDCFSICVKFYKQFNSAPKNHFQDELNKFIDKYSDAEKKQYYSYIETIQKMDKPDVKYIISRLHGWIREQQLKNALLDASEIVDSNPDKASSILYNALQSGIEQEESGLDYFNDYDSLRSRSQGIEYLMQSGITELDRLIGGFTRGRFVTIMGEYKGLKSWFLMHLGKVALFNGLNVVHISHEMSQQEVEERYDQLISGFMVDGKPGPNKNPLNRDRPESDWEVKYWKLCDDNLVKQKKVVVPSVLNIPLIIKNRNRIKNTCKGNLRIRKYPPLTCSMERLRNYLHYLEHFDGFKPDVIINDYVDDMDLSTYDEQLRHQLNDAYLDHKRLADELNALVITASQVNRKAIESPIMDKRNFAEDLRKAGNVDMAIGICRSSVMKQMDRANLFVVVNRTGSDSVWCQIGTAVQAGQFAVWSLSSKEAKQQMDEIEDSIKQGKMLGEL